LNRTLDRRAATVGALLTAALLGTTACRGKPPTHPATAPTPSIPVTVAGSHLAGVETSAVDWQKKTEQWWRKNLPPAVQAVCRAGGTERPWSGALLAEKRAGTFVCSSCGHELFSAQTKFESGTGWPSFYAEVTIGAVREIRDVSHGMIRSEVRCGRCDAHLGHVFDDGPEPTGLRYCINSVCLLHVPEP